MRVTAAFGRRLLACVFMLCGALPALGADPGITAGQIVARDPVTGVDTTGFHRLMVKGKNRLGVSLHSRRRMHEFHRRAAERGPLGVTTLDGAGSRRTPATTTNPATAPGGSAAP